MFVKLRFHCHIPEFDSTYWNRLIQFLSYVLTPQSLKVTNIEKILLIVSLESNIKDIRMKEMILNRRSS